MRIAALPVALLLAFPAFAQDFVALTPEQIGEIFCISRVGNDMAPVTGLLTPAFASAIAAAEAMNAEWAQSNPGEKPPLGDGIPWQAWPDHAPHCSVGGVSLEMDESCVRIEYGFPTEPGAAFVDSLHLKLIPGIYGETVWRIDNVAYGTDGDLRTALVSAFMD